MSWADKEFSLASVIAVLQKSEGRDKMGRTVQYATRCIAGTISILDPPKGAVLREIGDRSTDIMKSLSSARRVQRWGKELPAIQSLPKTLQIQNPVDMLMELGQKLTLITFMMCDHLGWLKGLGMFKGGKTSQQMIQRGLTFFCVSNALSALMNAKKLSAEEADGKRSALKQNVFMHILLVFQTAHLSKTYETHDAFVGACGTITSLMGLKAQWPDAKRA
jgi:hypothetical protein